MRLFAKTNILAFAFLFCAAPMWSDTITSYPDAMNGTVTFFNGLQADQAFNVIGCSVGTNDLNSPLGCSAHYAPTGDFGEGLLTFNRIDPKTFEFKGYVNIEAAPNSYMHTAFTYFLNMGSLVPDTAGYYVVDNTGQIPMEVRDIHGFALSLPGMTTSLYHDNGFTGLEVEGQVFEDQTQGTFDLTVTDMPQAPEPASLGLIIASGLFLLAFVRVSAVLPKWLSRT